MNNDALVLYTKQQRVAVVQLNRPEKRNALSPALVDVLKQVLDQISKDEEVRVIIFKGNQKAFSAGADLSYLQTLQNNSFEENLEDSQSLKDLFLKIHQSEKVTVAQVEGSALAGGCGLATVCDFVFATPESTFGYTEVKIGFIPAIVSYFLSRKIGEGKAKKWLLTGEVYTAEKALNDGLITFVESQNEINQKVMDFIEGLIKSASGNAIGLTKKLLDQMSGCSLEEAMHLASEFNACARGTTDCKHGIASFLNKEKIQW